MFAPNRAFWARNRRKIPAPRPSDPDIRPKLTGKGAIICDAKTAAVSAMACALVTTYEPPKNKRIKVWLLINLESSELTPTPTRKIAAQAHAIVGSFF